MNYIKKYENINFNSIENQYEKVIADYYNKLIINSDFKENIEEGYIDRNDIKKFFDELQEEFDSDNIGDEVYQITTFWKDSGTIMLGLYKAYGPNHAKIKYGFDTGDMSFINDTQYGAIEAYTIDETEIKSGIKILEDKLELWKNIK